MRSSEGVKASGETLGAREEDGGLANMTDGS